MADGVTSFVKNELTSKALERKILLEHIESLNASITSVRKHLDELALEIAIGSEAYGHRKQCAGQPVSINSQFTLVQRVETLRDVIQFYENTLNIKFRYLHDLDK